MLGRSILFQAFITDLFPIGRIDSVILVIPVLITPGCSGDCPSPFMHINILWQNSCCSVDAREVRKETTIEESLEAKGETTNARTANVEVSGKTPRGKLLLGIRHSKNYYERFLFVRQSVIILIGNGAFGMD